MAFATLALPCAAYEVEPLECPNCGAAMRIIALIEDADIVERILRHLYVWDPLPEALSPAGPDPPWPQGETLPFTYHPVPAHLSGKRTVPFGPAMADSPTQD